MIPFVQMMRRVKRKKKFGDKEVSNMKDFCNKDVADYNSIRYLGDGTDIIKNTRFNQRVITVSALSAIPVQELVTSYKQNKLRIYLSRKFDNNEMDLEALRLLLSSLPISTLAFGSMKSQLWRTIADCRSLECLHANLRFEYNRPGCFEGRIILACYRLEHLTVLYLPRIKRSEDFNERLLIRQIEYAPNLRNFHFHHDNENRRGSSRFGFSGSLRSNAVKESDLNLLSMLNLWKPTLTLEVDIALYLELDPTIIRHFVTKGLALMELLKYEIPGLLFSEDDVITRKRRAAWLQQRSPLLLEVRPRPYTIFG